MFQCRTNSLIVRSKQSDKAGLLTGEQRPTGEANNEAFSPSRYCTQTNPAKNITTSP
jgi:hypothetical protein